MFSKFKITILLIIIGVLGRLFFVKFIGIPNFEIITALTLVSAVFLGRVWGIVVPLSIIAITDVVIGNSPVLIFTWSAFAIIGVIGMIYKKYESHFVIASPAAAGRGNPADGAKNTGLLRRLLTPRNDSRRIIGLTCLGIISSVFFFLYTNFGWWMMTNMYPHTWDGLIRCYVMGLPFFKNNLIGNLIFVPMASSVAICAIALREKLKNQNQNLQLKINKIKI